MLFVYLNPLCPVIPVIPYINVKRNWKIICNVNPIFTQFKTMKNWKEKVFLFFFFFFNDICHEDKWLLFIMGECLASSTISIWSSVIYLVVNRFVFLLFISVGKYNFINWFFSTSIRAKYWFECSAKNLVILAVHQSFSRLILNEVYKWTAELEWVILLESHPILRS